MLPTIESLERTNKKGLLCISFPEKENDAFAAENQKMKQVLREIRSKVRDLGTTMWSKPL